MRPLPLRRLCAAGVLCLLVLTTTRAGSVAATAEPSFDATWRDGKAELCGYRLGIARYGHPRAGRAVAIYVTEPFSRSRHVKLDAPARAGADVVDVLKLNLVREFQTGIYDYHTMVSLFANTTDFAALKIAFTSAEWCGQVYEELNATGSTLTQRVASYFEGESSEQKLTMPTDGVQEDELFVRLRGLRGAWLQPGEKRTVPFLASPFWRRLAHRPTRWGRATIERLPRAETARVPAGAIAADVYVVRPDDGREGRYWVERAHPHRIVRWAWTAPAGASPVGGSDTGELTGSTRLDYWRTHDPGDERLLRTLGLAPPTR